MTNQILYPAIQRHIFQENAGKIDLALSLNLLENRPFVLKTSCAICRMDACSRRPSTNGVCGPFWNVSAFYSRDTRCSLVMCASFKLTIFAH
jgi:hypothetical protein